MFNNTLFQQITNRKRNNWIRPKAELFWEGFPVHAQPFFTFIRLEGTYEFLSYQAFIFLMFLSRVKSARLYHKLL